MKVRMFDYHIQHIYLNTIPYKQYWPSSNISNGFRARMYRVRGSARVRDDRVALKMSKGRVLESLFGAN